MHFGLMKFAFLALTVFALCVAIATALAYPALRPRLLRLAPEQRSRLLAGLCALPAIGACGLTAICFLPSVVAWGWPTADHCSVHALGHPHLCLIHPPELSGNLLSWSMIGVSGAYFLVCALAHLAKMKRQRRAIRLLETTAQPDRSQGVWVVESDVPFAWTTGIWRQRTIVSQGLLESLPGELIPAVIEHERAHERRHDVLLRIGAAFLSFAHFPGVRRQLLTDLELATEQACDEEAGQRIGNRFLVAQALLVLERALYRSQQTVGLTAASIKGSSVAQRVESLLAAPIADAFHARSERLAAAAILSILLFLTSPLHHLTETILGLFAR